MKLIYFQAFYNRENEKKNENIFLLNFCKNEKNAVVRKDFKN
jgi:hypothetical protein